MKLKKTIKSLLFACLLSSAINYGQSPPVMHLSFKLNDEGIDNNDRKVEENDGVTFYISGHYFRKIKSAAIKILSQTQIEDISFSSVRDLIVYRNAWIDRELKKAVGKGKVMIVSNPFVFEEIYIYEKSGTNALLRYRVSWMEVIECY